MKLFLKSIFIVLFLVGIHSSCKKSDISNDNTPVSINSNVIEKINNFIPEDEEIGNVYRTFRQKVENSDHLKSRLADERIDSALWNMETYLNTEYGFQIDTPYYKHSEYFDTASFTVNSYNNGIPVVDGDELDSFLSNIEIEFIDENTDNDNVYILYSLFEFDEVINGRAYTTLKVVRGVNYRGVYPPGWDPDNFSDPTCMYAIKPGTCGGNFWYGADEEYEKRYVHNTPISLTSSDYIMVYYFSDPVWPGDNGEDDRLWVLPYYSPDISLSTSGNDDLNGYLQATKDVIDDFNPEGYNDIYLGDVEVTGYAFNESYHKETGHFVILNYFKMVYIGANPN